MSERYTLHLGDNLEALRSMPDNSIDSIVTDPPYGLSFMGKKWDYDVPSVETWRECLRVLKPGGHLLAFAGTRTQHRMAVNIEDAGFEIRDMIAWLYGSGFPKSHDVSKAIDKCNGETGRLLKFTEWMRTTGLTARQIDNITRTNMGGHYLTVASQPAIPTPALWALLRPHCGEVPEWVDQLVQRIEAEREVVGIQPGAMSGWNMDGSTKFKDRSITAPATAPAKQWAGWGTALKPAMEPITVARKPLRGTVASNVLEYGTGGLNIDGCRVATDENLNGGGYSPGYKSSSFLKYGGKLEYSQPHGRWPANLIHDGSEEVTELFPETTSGSLTGQPRPKNNIYGGYTGTLGKPQFHNGDTGSAARFFYCAKASNADRNEGLEGFDSKQQDPGRKDGNPGGDNPRNRGLRKRQNHHPTVKPTDLMRYLCRLVTPPGGLILDPYMGSGSTGKAAMLEGFRFVGCEMEPEYMEIARARIAHAAGQVVQQELL